MGADGVVALIGFDCPEGSDEDAEILNRFGTRDYVRIEVVGLLLLEQLDGWKGRQYQSLIKFERWKLELTQHAGTWNSVVGKLVGGLVELGV